MNTEQTAASAPSAPGRLLLQITGILYNLLSCLSVCGLVVSTLPAVKAGTSPLAPFLVSLAQPVLGIVMGSSGALLARKPEKCMPCLILGAIVTFFGLLPLAQSLMRGAAQGTLLGNLIGLLIPVLYTLGAALNVRAARSAGKTGPA